MHALFGSNLIYLRNMICDKRCARYVFGFSKFDSVSDLICDDVKWLFSKYLVQENILKLLQNS
jgi:hypothetical protein